MELGEFKASLGNTANSKLGKGRQYEKKQGKLIKNRWKSEIILRHTEIRNLV